MSVRDIKRVEIVVYLDKEENVLKAGKMLESYVQFVYQKLLEFTDSEGTLVSTNVSILGKTGAKHEVI